MANCCKRGTHFVGWLGAQASEDGLDLLLGGCCTWGGHHESVELEQSGWFTALKSVDVARWLPLLVYLCIFIAILLHLMKDRLSNEKKNVVNFFQNVRGKSVLSKHRCHYR